MVELFACGLLKLLKQVPKRRPDNLFFVFEMDRKRSSTQVRPVGDILKGNGLIAFFENQLQHRLDQQVARLQTPAFVAGRRGSVHGCTPVQS